MNSLPKTSVLSQSHVPSYSLFAQLLASERLRVTVDRRAKTASFSPETRTLTLPSWSNFDNDAWLLFIAHEVGHALFTPSDSFTRESFTSLATKYGQNAVLGVANVFEDVRIERMIREKYRGLAGVFSRGYHSLMSRSFFGFSSLSSSEWSEKTVLDRINIYAKVGGLLRLSLTEAQESQWFNRALRAETFDDVMVLVAEVMSQLTEQQRQQAAQAAQNNQPSQGSQGNASQSSQPAQSQPAQGQPSQDGQPQPSQEQNGEPSQDAAPSNESQDGESSQSSQEQNAQSSQGGQPSQEPQSVQGDPFSIASQQAAEQSLRNSIDRTNENSTVVLPMSTAHLHYNDRSVEDMLAAWKATPNEREIFRQVVHQQRREQSSILASMIAAFRANQAAWQSRRVQVSRSGVIDTVKLSQYKLTEDLFLRRRSLPEAQNHGFVLHVDWSGSMETKMSVVLWQVLHLIWFAESIKVPVSVYAFSNSGNDTTKAAEYRKLCYQQYQHPVHGRLLELYRSNAPASVKQEAQAFLLALAVRFSGVSALLTSGNYYGSPAAVFADPELMKQVIPFMPKALVPVVSSLAPMLTTWDSDARSRVFFHSEVSLGGTPLHYALFASVDTVRKFRQVHRIEQCVSVWLTDGEDTDGTPTTDNLEQYPSNATGYNRGAVMFGRHDNATLIDPRSGRSFAVTNGRDLPALFALHRALTGATVLCIDISSAPLRSYSRVLSRSDLSVVANQVGVPSPAFGRRRVVRPKEIKQTRKRVVITSNRGSFDETGLMLVTRAQYADIGCDAYLVTHPDWWAAHDATSTVATTTAASSILSSSIDEDEVLTPEEREAEQRARPVRLAAALREGAAHIAMRRFADLLVPYMAAGREDATV